MSSVSAFIDAMVNKINDCISSHNTAASAHNTLFEGKSDTGHTHDDRYYTEDELKFTQKQSLQSGKILVFSNAFLVHVILTGTFSSLTANGVTTLSSTTINTAYRPKYSSAVWGNGDGRFGAVSVTSSGTIKIVNNSTATSLNIHTTVTYPLASAMP
ncbi:hypothetical protein [uncultured Methanobrevibacter sp.]|uniref:hypothetical protein n=1 Tax=uncultured Methanobrevibacter sp. TaxID=253161 RepID=UPI0025F85289|nr:hypothetical protein [uncultured Methanobrevibacter sp.]